jgi:hypothetical protein
MRIDRKEKIAGLDILKVRDALRAQGRRPFNVVDLEHSLKATKRTATAVIEELKARGWIAKDEECQPDEVQTTLAGNAFMVANAMKPIPRVKADKLLAGFLKRVEELNASDEFAYSVREVAVFGSYNGDSPEVGDVDLAVDMPQREIAGRDFVKYCLQRALESGRTFTTYPERLFYAERECWQFLKGRSPYVSVHPVSDIKATGAEARVIYTKKSG